MTTPKKSLSLSYRDREGLVKLMRWHLKRLYQITPWPLDFEATHLLWWPEEAWSILQQLKTSGQWANNGHDFAKLQVIPGKKPLIIKHKDDVLLSPGDVHRDSSGIIETSIGYPEFIDWYDEVRDRDADIKQVMKAWDLLLKKATSWLQIYKAFPESFEIIVGAASVFLTVVPDSWNNSPTKTWVIPKMREAWQQVRGTYHLSSRAHSMPSDIQEMINLARPVAGRLCAQAALLPPENSGKLDDSPFNRTWV